jgi:hypothetical protein
MSSVFWDAMIWSVFWDAMIFCNHLAKLLQKIVATCDVFRRVPLLPSFEKPGFSRIPLNCEPRIIVEMFDEFVKRRVCQNWGSGTRLDVLVFLGCYDLCNNLQDDYKR